MRLAATAIMGVGATLFLGWGASAAPSQCDAIVGNLVANCGFEGGTFIVDGVTGVTQPDSWTFTPAAFDSDAEVFSNTAVHSGKSFYGFGATGGANDTISQAITTISGDNYGIN